MVMGSNKGDGSNMKHTVEKMKISGNLARRTDNVGDYIYIHGQTFGDDISSCLYICGPSFPYTYIVFRSTEYTRCHSNEYY